MFNCVALNGELIYSAGSIFTNHQKGRILPPSNTISLPLISPSNLKALSVLKITTFVARDKKNKEKPNWIQRKLSYKLGLRTDKASPFSAQKGANLFFFVFSAENLQGLSPATNSWTTSTQTINQNSKGIFIQFNSQQTKSHIKGCKSPNVLVCNWVLWGTPGLPLYLNSSCGKYRNLPSSPLTLSRRILSYQDRASRFSS